MTPSELLDLAAELEARGGRLKDDDFSEPLRRLWEAAEEIGKSWSGSWLGYHARVYYEGFAPPPAGHHFSQEWGFEDSWPIRETIGRWQEYTAEEVDRIIRRSAGEPAIQAQETEATAARELFEEAKAKSLSAISASLSERPDKFLEDHREKIEEARAYGAGEVIYIWRPKRAFSRDMTALEKGLHTPPHVRILAEVYAINQPFEACSQLGKLTRRAASHLINLQRRERRSERIGTNVFIGHGRTAVWKDLKDFIQDRLHLSWDEFNRVPVAGVTNIARLSQMLNEAAIALLVMTGEDEQADGRAHARMNVVHEAGLFQGRLGFDKAIVLLEEGCEEFSNIQGLGQIRFPKGNIKAAFEEIRQLLEREGLLD